MSNTELVSTAEVARLTGRDIATVSRWAANGKLAFAYKGEGLRGAYVFKLKDVNNLLDSLKAKSPSLTQ